GLYVTYVSNGFINEDPFKEIGRYLDGINIDVKSFNEEFYRRICGARLEPVLNSCRLAKELGIHLEITYLIIPGENDSMKEIEKFCEWVLSDLGESTPIHFTRFYPHYKMSNIPPTPIRTLLNAYELAKKKGIKFVYLGNVPHGEYDNTYCPNCGELLIERYGFSAEKRGLSGNRCSNCGNTLPIVV
ncbi:MAG TPA: radical SAM protein, partial [Thermoplasmatales archaeon]|nr:radical SAM protein [Thermoplasmatales archaeon]